MSLGTQTSGSGPHLVLLHGWGLNSLVWDSILPRLTRDFTVIRIDLPGHGASSWPPEFHDTESLAAALMPNLPASCALLGWSLGGMAAIELAMAARARIEQLVLVSTTPKFMASNDWEHGLPAAAIDRFAELLESDYEATVREFLGLQVQGDEHARATLRELRQKMLAGGKPRLEALRAGLAILRAADQRDRLERIAVPTLVIAGEYDRMTPPQAARTIAAAIPGARFESIPRAGHAPFLSHPGEFCRLVLTFLGRAARATGS
jgi:pimeloyl-[acyl-carrier protein] methyl ester esterase